MCSAVSVLLPRAATPLRGKVMKDVQDSANFIAVISAAIILMIVFAAIQGVLKF